MANPQEAEEIIRSLNGGLGKHIEHSAKRVLHEILRYANSRSFNKVLAASETPSITFRIHDYDRIVIEYNDDGLTKADLEAICQPVTKEQTGECNFRTIVVANRKVHIQSGNFSFDFQHNILDPQDSIMRPVWVSPTEIVPNNMTRITLYLHGQGSKEEVENLRRTICSQFEKLNDASLVFLKDIKWMRSEFLDGTGFVIRSKAWQKSNLVKHGVCMDFTYADQRTESKVYHVTDHSADSSAAHVTLAFPLVLEFTPRVYGAEAVQLFNFIPLCASPFAFHVHSNFEFDDEAHGIVTTSARNNSIRGLITKAFFKAILQFLDDKILCDSYLLHKYPVTAAAKLTEYGLATLSDSRLFELLEMDLKSPKPRMHTDISRDWRIAMSRLVTKLLTSDERADKLKSLPIVQLRDGRWTSPASGPLYFPTSGYGSIPESLKFRDVTQLATFQPERRALYEKLGVTQPTAKEVRQKILDTFKSAETLRLADVYEYLRYLYLIHQSFNLSTSKEQPYDDVRILTTGMKLQNPHSTTVYYPGTDDPYSPESLLGPTSMANFLHPKIWNDGADKPGPFHPTWKVWLCDSIGIRERPSLLQAKAQSDSEPTNEGSSTDADGVVLSDAFNHRSYIEKTCGKKQLQSIARLFVNELKIRDASGEDMVSELCALRMQECKDMANVHRIYQYLDSKTISPETRRKFHDLPLILVKDGGHSEWLRASECFWSEADTGDLNSNLQKCYPDLEDFFLEKLDVKIAAYDKLLNTTSDNPEDFLEIITSFADDFGESIHKFLAEPVRRAKVFPVRNPGGEISLVSLDTDFAIADREGLQRELQDHIRILDFDLGDVRRLWPLFQWLNIQARYLSRCVKRSVTVSEDDEASEEVDPWDLRRKAYHITRVAATFDILAIYDDAAWLYQRLKALRIVQVPGISSELEITQDQKVVRSMPQSVTAHISDDDFDFTIYVARDKRKKIFSVLPRILEEWLRQDRGHQHTFEVISSLTSIIASDCSVLDEILQDQGIIELPFENNDAGSTKISSEGASECSSVQEAVGKPSEGDQGESLVLRGRESASEVVSDAAE
ncbi:hypothetical protein F52700_8991 [Fusarium sp. NRRL 52700]|nr:hypothetical protein F52700_8991 [Fusarium sp. NRRL 52700]